MTHLINTAATTVPTTTHPTATQTTLAGITCALGYGALAWSSHRGGGVFAYLAAHFFIAAVLFAHCFACVRRGVEVTAAAVLWWAAAFRVIGVAGAPVLEDDFYRYLLDGCVFVAAGTPYGVAPESLFAENNLPADCQVLLSRVNNPHLPTIYAPVLQLVFAALHLVAPVSVTALQVLFSLADLALIFLLCRVAPPRYVLLYAWCPLVVKEIAFTAHADIVGVALLWASLHLRHRGHAAAAVAVAALAVGAKIFAVLLLPFLLWRLSPRYWLLCAAVVTMLYAPFVLQGASDLAVLEIFLQQWRFNPSLFAAVAAVTGDALARAICFSLFASWWLFYFLQWSRTTSPAVFTIPRGDWLFGMLLLLSPVANPWYALWLLPFAVLRPRLWSWTAATVVPLAYLTGLNLPASALDAYQVAPAAVAAQVAAVTLALALDRRRGRV